MRELAVDDPEPGEVRVKTLLSTVCGTDMHFVDEMPVPPGTPMGHEAVGIVESVGAGVTGFEPGDRVASSCLTGCGTCDRCLEGKTAICETFGSPENILFGCQGEYYIVRGAELSMAKVPDSVDNEHAVLAADIMSTGFAAIERSGMQPGQTVAIFAQGPVGLCATAGARLLGAGKVITVESVPERIAVSKQLGADVVVEPGNAVADIMDLTDRKGVDVAVEALGHQETFENCCLVTRIDGTISSVGTYGAFPSLSLPTGGAFYHRKIVTTLCPSGPTRLEHLFELVSGGQVDLSALFTHRMKLADTPAAYELFRQRSGGVLKIALEP
jgi:threonine dehydrogenase-like Zn-dependent dehydrogenase